MKKRGINKEHRRKIAKTLTDSGVGESLPVFILLHSTGTHLMW